MSTLKTGALRGTSGTADSVQLHASNQSVTFPGNVTCSGTATGFGGGKVVKHAFGTYDTQQGPLTSSTWTDTGLSVSYTPVAANNIVYILCSQQMYVSSSGNNGDARSQWRLYEGSNLLQEIQFESSSSGSASELVGIGTFIAKFTAAGTSAVTLKTQYRYSSGSGNTYAQYNSRASNMIVVEMEP